MNRYKVAVLIVILALLGGYTCFWEIKKPKTGQEAGNAQKIFNINPNDAREIALRMKGLSLLLKKEGDQWRLERPYRIVISNKKIEDLLSMFDYGIVKVVDKNPSDYAQYGLVSPEIAFTVKVKGDAVLKTLLIGRNNPTNISCYARVKGRPEVLLVGMLYKRELNSRSLSYFQTGKSSSSATVKDAD